MKRKKVTVMWMPSASSRSRVLSISPISLSILALMLVISWIALGFVAYTGHGLYREHVRLKEENDYLREKTAELNELRRVVESLEDSGKLIRNFLGLDKGQVAESGLGQGGMPLTDLNSIAAEDAVAIGGTMSPQQPALPLTILQKARHLQESFGEVLGSMYAQKRLLDSTPSILPVASKSYWITSGFGWRYSPFTGRKEFHNGLDICDDEGTPIISPADGKLIVTGYGKYEGKYLRIDHGWGYITTYAHLGGFSVSPGEEVKRGQVIGFMGNTGRSTAPHLHFTIAINDKAVDPLRYILNNRFAKNLSR